MEQRWAQAISEIVDDPTTPRFRFLVRGESMLPTFHPGDEVVVERVIPERLCPGDVVLVQNGGHPRLHRFLGIRRRSGRCFLLTAGDHRRRVDALCPEEALIGRVVAAYRAGQVLQPSRGPWQAWRHRARTAFWATAYRIRKALPLLVLFSLLVARSDSSRASVTLISFQARWAGDKVQVTWETASEIDNMGFYIHRSEQEGGAYQPSTDLIPSQGDIIGAFYEWEDRNVEPGKTYYYKLEDLSSGGPSRFWGPVSAVAGQPTATFTPAATDTPTATLTPLSTATPSPTPSLTTTISPTPASTLTPTPVPSSSPTPTSRTTSTATATRRPSVTPGATTSIAQPTATAVPGEQLTPTFAPEAVAPTDTATIPVPIQPSLPASTTLAPSSLETLQPAPTATPATIAAEGSSEAEAPEVDQPSDEEVADARRRLTWTLIGVGGMIISGLLLVILGLTAYALYRWGLLRSG